MAPSAPLPLPPGRPPSPPANLITSPSAFRPQRNHRSPPCGSKFRMQSARGPSRTATSAPWSARARFCAKFADFVSKTQRVNSRIEGQRARGPSRTATSSPWSVTQTARRTYLGKFGHQISRIATSSHWSFTSLSSLSQSVWTWKSARLDGFVLQRVRVSLRKVGQI